MVDNGGFETKLRSALARDVKVLALELDEREAILAPGSTLAFAPPLYGGDKRQEHQWPWAPWGEDWSRAARS
jgi:hypothetical protein